VLTCLLACGGTRHGVASGDGGSGGGDLAHAPDPCVVAGSCAPGEWHNVTPSGVDLTSMLSCDNIGTETVQKDPLHPEQLYTLFTCQGLWKSLDYGQTWKGPINTGMNGVAAGDCAGGITIPPRDTRSPPVIYEACIRGKGTGFSRSSNGGVDWIHPTVDVPGSNNQFYPPLVDPYDPDHLLMAGHGVAVLAESFDGGQSWKGVALDPAMMFGGTGGINFIDTGDAAATRRTFLWLSQASGGGIGTWRTSDDGASWTRVETNEHPGGISQIYQPDDKGVVYMAGLYSKNGYGVFRSSDYGQTWMHVGQSLLQERVVFGTPKHVYAMMGNEVPGTGSDPALQMADQPGGGDWTSPPTPPSLMQGPLQALVTSDGASSIVLLASWSSGLWRYVEPQ
jgi:hypothetical protein